jgi:hypothetical protein
MSRIIWSTAESWFHGDRRKEKTFRLAGAVAARAKGITSLVAFLNISDAVYA